MGRWVELSILESLSVKVSGPLPEEGVDSCTRIGAAGVCSRWERLKSLQNKTGRASTAMFRGPGDDRTKQRLSGLGVSGC